LEESDVLVKETIVLFGDVVHKSVRSCWTWM